MYYRAYWLHEQGDVVPVENIHIAEVIKDPQRFDYRRERIDELYARYNEPMGHEGRAREKIMMELIKHHGWIRARYKPGADTWTIELHTLTDPLRELIHRFFQQPDVLGTKGHSYIQVTELCKPGGMKKHPAQPATSPLLNDRQKEELYQQRMALAEADIREHFVPHLVRVGTETRPRQITFCGYFGLERCFFVQEYSTTMSKEMMLKEARKKILRDRNKYNGCVPFFGKKAGYALYPAYGTAIALDLDGEIRDDLVVKHANACIAVTISKSKLGKTSMVNIPRFELKEPAETTSLPPGD